MAHDHSHTASSQHQKPLWIALALTTSFMLAEVIGSYVTGSLALLSDAAHMFTDAAALGVSLVAIQIAKRAADRKRTFGYYRFEILAAVFNASLLLVVAGYIIFEAYERLRSPQPIMDVGMLAIAFIGLAVNLISMRLLRAGSESSLNVKGAYLEVWSDMLGSLGVILAALVIRFTNWVWVDTVMAVLIGLWVIPRTWVLLKEAVNVLLQGVPKGFDLSAVEAAIQGVEGVREVHDLHIWSLTSGTDVLSTHVVVDLNGRTEQGVLSAISKVVSGFKIHSTTIQVEASGFNCSTEAPRE